MGGVVTRVSSGELTSVEQSLVERVGCGKLLDLVAEGEAVDATAMRSWGKSRAVRASVLRDILRGRLAADPDPHGVRLRGARIIGRLDLENLTTDVSLKLVVCLLEEGVVARDARLAALSLEGCQLEHPAEPPLDGARLTCSVLSLNSARVIGHAKVGAVRLAGARIGGSLDCSAAELRNGSGPALDADNLQVDQHMYLDGGFTATGSGGDGAVRLLGAHIGGQLSCSGAKLHNGSGPALDADSLQVGQHMFLAVGFTATGGGKAVAVNLAGARVGGAFFFASAQLKHTADSHRRLAVDGLTYAGLPQYISPQDWRNLLRDGTHAYAAQPYQQLAAAYRALGDDRQARQTLMAQRDDQLARTQPTAVSQAAVTLAESLVRSQPARATLVPTGRLRSNPTLTCCVTVHGRPRAAVLSVCASAPCAPSTTASTQDTITTAARNHSARHGW